MKAKTTRRALFLSALSLLLCISMLVGTTFAWFTDEVVTGMNTIAAGNLDVELLADGDEVDSNTMLFKLEDPNLWEPGVVVYENLQVVNKGTLALKYQMTLNFGHENDLNGNKLSDVLKVAVIDKIADDAKRADVLAAAEASTQVGTLAEFSMSGELEAGKSSTEQTIVIFWEPNDNATDNLYNVNNGQKTSDEQPLHIEFGVKLQAIQKDVEADSFGPDYDEGLDPEAVYVFNAQELKDAMLVRGAKIALNSDITIDATIPLQWGAYMFVANGREVTIDLNGHDIIVADDALLKTKAVFTTANGGTLNIVGDGTVTVENGKSGIFHAMNKNDQINIYGGTYVSNADNGSDSLAIMYTNSGNIDVYGGKFLPLAGVQCANAEDRQGNRLSIVFHEGAMLNTELYQEGDSTRIQLAEGCYLKNVQIDGEDWWQVAKKQEDTTYTSEYNTIMSGYGASKDYVLDGNLSVDNYIMFGDNTTNSIDLNGKTVSATGGFLFAVDGADCSLTIDGEGTVTTAAGYAGFANTSGSLNVNGGTYQLGETNNAAHFYSQNSATIVINDGTFISADANTPIVYCINGFVEINGGFFQNTANPSAALLSMGNNLNYVNNQKITLRGGTFVNWNPMNSAFAMDWPQCPALIVLADGYKMTSETQTNGDVWYSVVAE